MLVTYSRNASFREAITAGIGVDREPFIRPSASLKSNKSRQAATHQKAGHCGCVAEFPSGEHRCHID
jgi:hypothetical protein